jgi:hypothetical protein|tara:strand:+ start:114 stop:329 length:216 start_codon:yes stop_codon:yes gene_type:complete
MSDSNKLRDALLVRLNKIVADTHEELQPSMVSACVNFLKAFPPESEHTDMTGSITLHDSLQKYAGNMPYRS